MLALPGNRQRFCDGITRRSFLRIGGLGMGGLSLPQLLHVLVHEAAVGALIIAIFDDGYWRIGGTGNMVTGVDGFHKPGCSRGYHG